MKQLAETYDIGRTAVCDIIKREDEYDKLYQTNIGSNMKHSHIGHTFEKKKLNLHDWFKMSGCKTLPVSGPIQKERAIKSAEQFEISGF